MSDKKRKITSEILNSRPELKETKIGILKGVYGVVPFVGPMINEILFDIPNRIYQSRINDTVEILSEKISLLDNETFNKEYLESEDFFDFTQKMITTSLKIKSKEKKNALANFYIASFCNQANFETDSIRLFLIFITELSIIQLSILKLVEFNQKELNEIASYSNFYKIYCDSLSSCKLTKYEFKYYINDLENKSLISLGAGLNDFLDESSNFVFEDHKSSSVVITELGENFIKYLKE